MKKILETVDKVVKSSKKNIIDMGVDRLDIVSREEFEIQKKILQKVRLKLDSLEKKVDDLIEQNR